jgi:Protein of unknown function (DUF4240)
MDHPKRHRLAVPAAVVAVVFLALLLGYRLGADPATPRAPGTSPMPVAVDPPGAQAPGSGSLDVPPHAAEPAPAGQQGFWQLTSDTRTEADDDTGRQSSLLEERLRKLPPDQIVDFARIRHRLDERAYTWDLWAAAFVIEDGCSDDCFRDFRAYLISLGREPYDAALRDPDSLAPVVQDAETGDWENADNVAPDAYESATGEDIPVDDSDLSGTPRGQPWDDEDEDALVQRYPQLAAKFR